MAYEDGKGKKDSSSSEHLLDNTDQCKDYGDSGHMRAETPVYTGSPFLEVSLGYGKGFARVSKLAGFYEDP